MNQQQMMKLRKMQKQMMEAQEKQSIRFSKAFGYLFILE